MTDSPDSTSRVTRQHRLRVSPRGMVANGIGLVALLTAAWFVAQSTPTDEVWQSAIPVHGEVGDTLIGRNIEATVGKVRVAEEVVASNGWSGPTAGVWVVVDASVAWVIDDRFGSIGTADLVINETRYSASERPDRGTLATEVLATGIPVTGPLMFEVPRELVESGPARTAQIQFAGSDDTRTDSILVVEVDLTALPIESTVETSQPIKGLQ